MRRFIFVLMVALCCTGISVADELIANGSFEEPPIDDPNCLGGGGGWDYCPSDVVPGWTVEWMYSSALGNLEFQNASVNLGGPWLGSQYVEMDTHGSPGGESAANVRIYQDLLTCAGDYDLSYAWRTRPNVPDSSMHLQALVGGSVVGDHDGLAEWTEETYTASFLTIGTRRVQFQEIGGGDQLGSFLDAVSFEGANAALPNTCTTANIKLGSDPNSINTCSHGTTPVTIWGSATFDVSWIDPELISFASASVKTVGRSGKSLCSIEDSGSPDSSYFDGWNPTPDGYPDLTCHFVTFDLSLEDLSDSAEIGMTVCSGGFDNGCQGTDPVITATDAVNIVKDC